MLRFSYCSVVPILFAALIVPAIAQDNSFKIPPVDLKEQIIWGSTCEGPDGFILGFGGQDQLSDEIPRTRIKIVRQWKSIGAELRQSNRMQKHHDCCQQLVMTMRRLLARDRHLSLEGYPANKRSEVMNDELRVLAEICGNGAGSLRQVLQAEANGETEYEHQQRELAVLNLSEVQLSLLTHEAGSLVNRRSVLAVLFEYQVKLEQTAEMLDAEPPARYLSPLVYDPQTKLFVLTAGDHGDYLTNDLWLFDPATKKWEHRHPKLAPAPRGDHTLKANGDGTVTLSGGYTYTSSTSYLGAQYKPLNDGDWTYNIATNSWKGPSDRVASDTRVYRTGPFHPSYFLQGPEPDRAATKRDLESLPANRWVECKTPHKPEMVRTWGHAVLDPDHDLVLVFSGGHSAHCGSDVLHYHLATGRWELPSPVEFPLGQTYTNTSYPEGYNLNRRPWMTGHTYQSYNYDPGSHKLHLNARTDSTYVYDPTVGDWTGRFSKPKPMAYNDCFYTLNTLPTPHGLICWTGHGGLFKLDAKAQEWREIKCGGDKLPNSVVDASTFVYDSKRDRLIFVRSEYGKKYDGSLHLCDLKTGTVTKSAPVNAAAVESLDLKGVDRAVYDPDHDLVLFSTFLPGESNPSRKAFAYDCATDRWQSFAIGYEVDKDQRPSHPAGPGHSCGLLFDAKRHLIWGIDTHHCRVYALRLDPATADTKAIE